jgi:hypothetical protein
MAIPRRRSLAVGISLSLKRLFHRPPAGFSRNGGLGKIAKLRLKASRHSLFSARGGPRPNRLVAGDATGIMM